MNKKTRLGFGVVALGIVAISYALKFSAIWDAGGLRLVLVVAAILMPLSVGALFLGIAIGKLFERTSES